MTGQERNDHCPHLWGDQSLSPGPRAARAPGPGTLQQEEKYLVVRKNWKISGDQSMNRSTCSRILGGDLLHSLLLLLLAAHHLPEIIVKARHVSLCLQMYPQMSSPTLVCNVSSTFLYKLQLRPVLTRPLTVQLHCTTPLHTSTADRPLVLTNCSHHTLLLFIFCSLNF